MLLLGAQETALAVTRSLGRRGLRVLVSGEPAGVALRSRYCAERLVYPHARAAESYWGELLLGRDGSRFAEHVILPTCDEGIQFIAQHHSALRARYLLDMHAPRLQLELLDKQRTLELGRKAGVHTPGFWTVKTLADLDAALPELAYPVLVKPIHSHLFRAVFGTKHLTACDVDELAEHARAALQAGLEFMVCELVAGPDSLLSSYYTYLTPEGEALFHFTKRVVRRFPAGEGGASYHVAEWLPGTAEAGERFLRGIGYQGLANVEFKLDRSEGVLKLIECNARFTAAQSLVGHCGIDMPWISYCGATGMEQPRYTGYRNGVYLWNPQSDFRAYRQLRRAGRITATGWLRAALRRPKITPYTDASDPMPALAYYWQPLRRILGFPMLGLQQGWRLLRRPAQRSA